MSHNHSQLASFPYRNIAGILTVIAVGVLFLLIVLFAKSSREIPPLVTTVTRGNLVIAFEKTTLPNQRLYIYQEEQAYYHSDSGTTLQTDPAQTYFDRTVRPTPTAADTFTATLSADEWQTLDAWWMTWCRTSPAEISVHGLQPAYRIALRCGLMTGSLFTVAPETLPPAVRTILRRATNNVFS
jgi:hypothetical protein